MYRIGIDVGSAYTKYCVMRDGVIVSLSSEKTPIRQRAYFEEKIKELYKLYPKAEIISCGYGKANVEGIQNINELIALAKGVFHSTGENGIVLDIGGQDTKIIIQEKGHLKEFFVNDKCAAGSGMFLTSVLSMIDMRFEDVEILSVKDTPIDLFSTCAVFAQSEIVEMIANNCNEEEIISSVLCQIVKKAKPLLSKVEDNPILLTGGLSQIRGLDVFISHILCRKCLAAPNGSFLASLGCALI